MAIDNTEPTANPSPVTLPPGATTISLQMSADPACQASVRLFIENSPISFAGGSKERIPPQSPVNIGPSRSYDFPIVLILDAGSAPQAMVYVNVEVQPLDAGAGPGVQTGVMIPLA